MERQRRVVSRGSLRRGKLKISIVSRSSSRAQGTEGKDGGQFGLLMSLAKMDQESASARRRTCGVAFDAQKRLQAYTSRTRRPSSDSFCNEVFMSFQMIQSLIGCSEVIEIIIIQHSTRKQLSISSPPAQPPKPAHPPPPYSLSRPPPAFPIPSTCPLQQI